MTQFRCPHCDQLLKVIPQNSSRYASGSTFESTADFGGKSYEPPKGVLSSLFYFMKGGKAPARPAPSTVTIRVEEIDRPNNRIRIHDMDHRITFNIVQQIAVMIARGHEWTRDNLVKYTSLSENRVRIYQREFKRLGYLEVSANNRSEITHTGRRFLRGIGQM